MHILKLLLAQMCAAFAQAELWNMVTLNGPVGEENLAVLRDQS